MINSKELMIGNLLKTSECEICTVIGFGDDFVMLFDGYKDTLPNMDDLERSKSYPLESVEPILLSPEVLEKIGFEKKEADYGRQSKKEYSLCINNADGFRLFFGFYYGGKDLTDFKILGNGFYDDGGEMSIEHCKSIHQLQNLYKCLSQTELPINNL